MLSQKLLAHARLVVKTVQRSLGSNLYQIAVTFFIFRQDQQMVICIAVGRSARNVVIVFFADIKFAADDWFDSRLFSGIHEMHRAKYIAVIGHGNRRHAELFRTLAKFVNVAGTVEHGIVSIEMQMDELRHWVQSGSDSNWSLPAVTRLVIHSDAQDFIRN